MPGGVAVDADREPPVRSAVEVDVYGGDFPVGMSGEPVRERNTRVERQMPGTDGGCAEEDVLGRARGRDRCGQRSPADARCESEQQPDLATHSHRDYRAVSEPSTG